MEFQTRSEVNGMGYYDSLGAAMKAAAKDSTIWKISFTVGKESVRLVKRDGQWIYEPLFPMDRVNLEFMD
jgi:hypothetical protein